MAKQQRPAPKNKPITANPLFPAVVALWFGALFGLSSLAVRVSVIESLVMASGIDLIVPAAAPPLGITARILMALLLAAVGALIGAMIARRLARPSPEVRERKRNVHGQDAPQQSVRVRDSHPDAPARRPISAHEELGEGGAVGAAATPGLLAGRRRALTVEADQGHFVPPEFARLPGGDPQILDLAGAEIEPVRAEPALTAAPLAAPQHAAAPITEDATDLNAYSDSPASSSEDAAPAPAPSPFQPQFAAVTDEPQEEIAVIDHGLEGRQVFGMTPVEPQDPSTRQIFGESGPGDGPSIDPVSAHGIPKSVFDRPAADPLFAKRSEPLPQLPAAADRAPAAITVAIAPLAPETTEPLSPVADLDMTALALRLQESLRRRRAARAAAQTEAVVAHEPQPVLARFAPAVEAGASSAAQPARIPAELPPAMRPLSFDDFDDEDDDGEALAGLVPPRHIALPQTEAALSPAEPSPPPSRDADTQIEEEAEDGAETDDTAYASLLGVSAPAMRPTFVRIDEPEAATDHYEPVVIFPGQIPSAPSEVAPVISPVAEEHAAFRRFDAPASAGQGQPIAGNTAAPMLDADEAERSLRAALANLQRISGAA
ncbi:hypothetical protein ACFFF7_11440 [Novosphingobium aquiterrae]|uniref:DUF1049 domain-containing protein n=1 Tax=Novosphingobium aquiterrae TaxID=624388 RepID=A0ABV6PJL6_9SPHN